MIPTLLPAYGRDYKNKAAIIEDINSEKDFLMSSFKSVLINKNQLISEGFKSVVVRYANARKVTSLKLTNTGDFN
jgi:hypothetical protein